MKIKESNKPNRYVKVSMIEWELGFTLRYEALNEGKQLYSVSEYTKESIETKGYSPFLEYAERILLADRIDIDARRLEGRLWEDMFYKGNLPEVTKEEFDSENCGEGLGKHVRTLSKYVSETGIADLLVFQKES